MATLALLAASPPVSAQTTSTTPDTTPGTTTTSVPDTTTITTTTTPPTTTAPTTAPTTTATTSPSATVAPTSAPATTVAATTTTVTAPGPTVTTPNQAQLAALVQDLGQNVAHAQAVQAYLAAQVTAAARLQPGAIPAGSTPTGTGGGDPVLIQVAIAQLKAAATRAGAQRVFDQARGRIAQVAVALYVGEQLPDVTDPTSGSAAARSAFLASILDEERRQLHVADDALAAADQVFTKSRAEADNLVNARAALLYAAAVHAPAGPPASLSALAGLQPIAAQKGPALTGGLVGASPTILGQTVLSADEILGWYGDTRHQPHLTVPLTDLVADYGRIGAADGVRWDIAIAQAAVETAYFDFPSYGQVASGDNNFAGIGACDTCSHGFQYPDAATGVAAHLQLLHGYATPQPIAGPLTKLPSVAGCCPTWLALTGVWASSTTYGYAILNTYQSMVVWALARRSAAAGL